MWCERQIVERLWNFELFAIQRIIPIVSSVGDSGLLNLDISLLKDISSKNTFLFISISYYWSKHGIEFT